MVLVMVKYERYMSKAKEISNGWIVMKGYSGELGLQRRGYAGRKSVKCVEGCSWKKPLVSRPSMESPDAIHISAQFYRIYVVQWRGSNVTVVATTISHVIGTRSAKKETRREPSELIKTSTGPLTSS